MVLQRGWTRGEPLEALTAREWLVTNGLGGYACGTIGGAATRRFHGPLVAALPAPLGRTMMLNHLEEWISGAGTLQLEEFFLDYGLPVWRYSHGLEKRVMMPYGQNTTYVVYRLNVGRGFSPPPGRGGRAEATPYVTLNLRPSVKFRPHEGVLADPAQVTLSIDGPRIELRETDDYPTLRLLLLGDDARFDEEPRTLERVIYPLERDRGYDHEGPLSSPGVIRMTLRAGQYAGLVASVEPWDVIEAMSIDDALAADRKRREKMLARADVAGEVAAQLVLAADQFLIRPHTRSADEARIAGYHWFTDWGRDTMISLEGLTLVTGRHREAGSILRTFATYIRDGLIPNLFPEGEHGGLYHTADATMWFFHAVARYVRWTEDRGTLRALLPRMIEIIDHHLRGTHFNIRVDPADGLLTQGAEGYQLTWMDAKVDGWVVTPRRGKPVEINALFYNALRILQRFLEEEGQQAESQRMRALADRVYESFNARFWYDEGQHLYDVRDPDDPALRPNQLFAVALDHPVLDPSRWQAVVDVVERELVTPVGLRSLGRTHPDYKPSYHGDLRTRDAAYHQGTVWGWLIGPFVDAWMKVHRDPAGALRFLDGFTPHLADACIGTVGEVFDAEAPFTPRGCAAQAWSVAEVLRCRESLRP